MSNILYGHRKFIKHVESQLNKEDLIYWDGFISQITKLEKLATEAAGILEEVRTGEDFECVCWDKAAEIKGLLGIKD